MNDKRRSNHEPYNNDGPEGEETFIRSRAYVGGNCFGEVIPKEIKDDLRKFIDGNYEICVDISTDFGKQALDLLELMDYEREKDKVSLYAAHIGEEEAEARVNQEPFPIIRKVHSIQEAEPQTLEVSVLVWNQADMGMFMTVVLAAKHAFVKVYGTASNTCLCIDNPKEVAPILPDLRATSVMPDSFVPEDTRKAIVSACMPSEEVKEYLLNEDLTKRQIIDLLLGSPIPLSEKARLAHRFEVLDDVMWATYYDFGKNYGMRTPEESLTQAKRYSFTGVAAALDGKACSDPVWEQALNGSIYLDIPIPFKTGCIVSVVNSPYSAANIAMLLEPDHHASSTTPTLYQGDDGLWRMGRTNTPVGLDGGQSAISPIYYLSIYRGPLSEEVRLLIRVRDVMKKQVSHKRTLRQMLRQHGIDRGFTNDELSQFLESC